MTTEPPIGKPQKLKVYGGSSFIRGKQVRVIVAARSMKRASELLKESYSYMREYWSVTGNKMEIETATAKPEQPFYFKDRWGEEKPLEFTP
jgi:hypothetical protein